MDGFGCDDVNECTEMTDQCDQNCHNNIGSYTCSCNTGYRLNPDGFRCDGMLSYSSGWHPLMKQTLSVILLVQCYIPLLFLYVQLYGISNVICWKFMACFSIIPMEKQAINSPKQIRSPSLASVKTVMDAGGQ